MTPCGNLLKQHNTLECETSPWYSSAQDNGGAPGAILKMHAANSRRGDSGAAREHLYAGLQASSPLEANDERAMPRAAAIASARARDRWQQQLTNNPEHQMGFI